jgi:hypothetical protein
VHGVRVTTNKQNVPVVKTREENKSGRMHPEWKQKHTNVCSGDEKEKKTKVEECIQIGNKNIPTYLVGMRRKRKQK